MTILERARRIPSLSSSSTRAPSDRVFLLLSVLLYIAIYNWTYKTQISDSPFAWYGLVYNPPGLIYQLTSWLMCVAPALWMPTSVQRPSMTLFYPLYIFTYIPSVFILFHIVRPEFTKSEVLLLNSVLFLSISIIQLSYLVKTHQFVRYRLSNSVFSAAIVFAGLLCLIYLTYFFGPIMSWPDFDDTATFRIVAFEFSKAGGLGSRFTAYAISWLQGALVPFCVAVALFRSRYLIAIVLCTAYPLTYMMQGTRGALLDPVALVLVYWWLRKKRTDDGARLIAVVAGILLCGSLLPLISDSLYWFYLSVMRFRMFESNVFNIAIYYDFFKLNPPTYFTHITGVSYFVHNPYSADPRPLPFIVSSFEYLNGWDANAGLWAQDGLGGLGLIGVPLVSAVCGIVFWFLDSITAEWNPRFVSVTLAVTSALFLNIPLSTVVVSGGLGLLLLMYWIYSDGRTLGTQ